MTLTDRLLRLITILSILIGAATIGGALLDRPILFAAVPTESMLPHLEPGALIPVIPILRKAALQPGEIVVFRTPGASFWIVHRIIGGNGAEGYVTKGDHNTVPDRPLVRPADIAGRVPQVGATPLHIPGVGQIAIGAGTRIDPRLVGLLFLVVLLVGRSRPRARRRQRRPRPYRTGTYLLLALLVWALSVIPSRALSLSVPVAFVVVESRSASVQTSTLIALGEVRTESVVVPNITVAPLQLFYRIDHPDLHLDHPWRLIPPHGQDEFALTLSPTHLGEQTGTLTVTALLPFLPPTWIAALMVHGPLLAIALNSAVPSVLLLSLSFVDPAVRAGLRSLLAALTHRLVPFH